MVLGLAEGRQRSLAQGCELAGGLFTLREKVAAQLGDQGLRRRDWLSLDAAKADKSHEGQQTASRPQGTPQPHHGPGLRSGKKVSTQEETILRAGSNRGQRMAMISPGTADYL